MKTTLIFISLLTVVLLGVKPRHRIPIRCIIFLHNKFIEDHGTLEKHPSYGRPEYAEILSRFRDDGFLVESEKRPPNTDEILYARKVVKQIDSILGVGVSPENITIVGTSKGGYIAQFVSSMIKNSDLNYVFIGSSFRDEKKDEAGMTLHGRVLSITEASDTGSVPLSTQSRYLRSHLRGFREIVLHTNLHHGFLFKALDAWIVPTEEWARN